MKSSGYSPGQGFSPEKATALRQILQKKGTAKVKPDPELAKSKSELVKKSSEPPKSKELVQALKITETKAKQSLAFEAKTEAPKVPESKLIIYCLLGLGCGLLVDTGHCTLPSKPDPMPKGQLNSE